jgi:hypothetical protein
MGWRAKFVFLLMIYAAGFVSAVYFMTPPTQEGSGFSFVDKVKRDTAFQPEELVKSINVGLKECAGMSKKVANHTSVFIRQQLKERQQSVLAKSKS